MMAYAIIGISSRMLRERARVIDIRNLRQCSCKPIDDSQSILAHQDWPATILGNCPRLTHLNQAGAAKIIVSAARLRDTGH